MLWFLSHLLTFIYIYRFICFLLRLSSEELRKHLLSDDLVSFLEESTALNLIQQLLQSIKLYNMEVIPIPYHKFAKSLFEILHIVCTKKFTLREGDATNLFLNFLAFTHIADKGLNDRTFLVQNMAKMQFIYKGTACLTIMNYFPDESSSSLRTREVLLPMYIYSFF